jgi:hypothetical protein
MDREKLKTLVKKSLKDEELMKKFENDPIGTVKSWGIAPEALSPEILDKIESDDTVEDAGDCKSGDVEFDGDLM